MKKFNVKPGLRPFLVGLIILSALAISYFVGPLEGVGAFAMLGAVDTDVESDELKAIKAVSERIDKEFKAFQKSIGEKVSKDELESLTTAINSIKETLAKLEADLAAAEEEVATDEELAAAEEKMTKKIDAVNDALTKIGKKMEELQEDVAANKDRGTNRKVKALLTTKDIEDFIAKTFKDGRKTNEEAAIKIDSGMVFIRRKAAEDMVNPTFFEGGPNTDISAFTGRFIDPVLYQRRRKKNLILDYFDIQTINAPALLYLEKIEISGDIGSSDDTGGADWIVSGTAKPKRSFRVTTGKVESKKVAIFGTVDDKLLRDIPSLENWIREDFMLEIKEKYNDGLLNNNPAVDEDAPLGLKQNAIQFDPSPAFENTITSPNYIDGIAAAAAQMATLFEEAVTAFVSWDVYFRILTLKDNEARYLNNEKVYVDALGNLYIGGVQIVPVSSEDVPSTHLLLIGADVGFKIKNYGALVFERGLNGEDFRNDKTSFRGYQEVLSYIPTHRENSVMYDTWVNIFAGIEATS